jgi:hypothetical protein
VNILLQTLKHRATKFNLGLFKIQHDGSSSVYVTIDRVI